VSWLTERLAGALAERGVAPEVVARQLGVERSHLTAILAGSRQPNESLVKRLAGYLGQDPAECVQNTQQAPAPVQREVPTGFVKVARLADVPPGEVIMVHDGAAAIANVDGRLYAFQNSCPHAGGNLGEGVLEECVVECPWHAGRWDVRTGRGLSLIAGDDIRVFELRLSGEDVEIKLE
jgi:nitrite reductase/ring-hydroxylating ferredoxin subunit